MKGDAKMKNIAIVTINYGHNYGNKLQNYAMQEIYQKMGFQVQTIKFRPTLKLENKTFFQKVHGFTFFKLLDKMKRKVNGHHCSVILNKRLENFEKFNQRIHFTKEYNEENYRSFAEEFDYYSVGSDQVWNAYFADFSEFYLIDFISSEHKIAYAASFGVESVPDEYQAIFKQALSKFKMISCRETAGASLVQQFISKTVPVVIDPTMLLTADEWMKIAVVPEKYRNQRYVFVYILGQNRNLFLKKIRRFARDHQCEIVDVSDPYSPNYAYGPCEFLGLIHDAYAVFTDSFHATVFSILFQKPFYIFERVGSKHSMYSRIDTLLNTLNLKDRKYSNSFDHLFSINYAQVDSLLLKERLQSEKYLKEALDIKECDLS